MHTETEASSRNIQATSKMHATIGEKQQSLELPKLLNGFSSSADIWRFLMSTSTRHSLSAIAWSVWLKKSAKHSRQSRLNHDLRNPNGSVPVGTT